MASQLGQHILHDVAVEEVDDAAGVARVALRVGDHHDGGALLVEFGEQVHHLLAVLGVEVAGGLVGEDELGVGDHGAGDGDALLLSARELLREVLGAVGDGHPLHHRRDPLLALRRADVQVAQRQLDVLIDVQLVDEVEALEHEADVALAELGALPLLQLSDLLPQQLVAARGGVVQEAEDVEQRGFAAARRPHHGDELAVLYFERDTVQREGLDVFRAEDFGEVLYLYHIVRYFDVLMYPTLRCACVGLIALRAFCPFGAAQGICLDIIRIIRSIRRQLFAVHSFFNASAGFVFAARRVCQRTEPMAMTNDSSTVTTKIQGCKSMR